MTDTPCRKCDKRTAECHAGCEKYKAFRNMKELQYKQRADDERAMKYLQAWDAANKERYLKKKRR